MTAPDVRIIVSEDEAHTELRLPSTSDFRVAFVERVANRQLLRDDAGGDGPA